jgi:hypothetical protein
MAVSKLRFVEGLASTSPSQEEQARRRHSGKPGGTLCDLPSGRAPVFDPAEHRFLLALETKFAHQNLSL